MILKKNGRRETNKEKTKPTHTGNYTDTRTQAQTRNTRTNPQGSRGAFFTIPGHDCNFRVTPGMDILRMSRTDHWTKRSQLRAATSLEAKMLFFQNTQLEAGLQRLRAHTGPWPKSRMQLPDIESPKLFVQRQQGGQADKCKEGQNRRRRISGA